MTLDECQREMEAHRDAAEEAAKAQKDSHFVLERLFRLYKRFGQDERNLADQVISGWLLANDEGLRFDALALIHEFKISPAAPALQILMDRLASDTARSAPFERAKIERILLSLYQ